MTQTPPERPAGSGVGPLAQEAAMLLDVVADRLEQLKSPPQPPSSTEARQSAGPTASAEPTAGAEPPPNADAPAGGPPGAAPKDGPEAPAHGAAAAGSTARAANSTGPCPECGSVPGAYCTACPLCRFMALLRGERPEATAKLVDGALMIVRTLRSMVPDLAESASAGHQHPHTPRTPPGSPTDPADPTRPTSARRTGLEHINIL